MVEIRASLAIIGAGWTRSLAAVTRIALVFAAVTTGASVARADWGFTHWGMTPEQVVGASGGTAHLIAPADRKRDDVENWEMDAEGVVNDGGLSLHGGFMFDTHGGGLVCVLYNATGDNVNKLRDGLIARYGRPLKDSDFGAFRTLIWQTPDALELGINQTPLTAAVSHCVPGR